MKDKTKKTLWIVIPVALVLLLFLFLALGVPAIEIRRFLYPEKQKMTTFPTELYLDYTFCEIPCDGVTLAAWYLPAQVASDEYDAIAETDRTVIFSHNYESNKDMEEINAMYLARSLCAGGYNVLMFDYAGSGSSTGSGYFLGTREADELSAVIDYAKNTLGSAHISVLGWAFGASSALTAADGRVDAVIADSACCRLEAYLDRSLSEWVDLPSFMTPVGMMYLKAMLGDYFDRPDPIDCVSKDTGVAYLFIQGAKDRTFPTDYAPSLYAAASLHNTAELWMIGGCDHIMGYVSEPETYADRILTFLDTVYGAEKAE